MIERLRNILAGIGMIIAAFLLPVPAMAADYTYYTNFPYGSSTYNHNPLVTLVGFNKTHGFSKAIPVTDVRTYGDSTKYWQVSFTVPDDGSDWEIVGVFNMIELRQYNDGGGVYKTDVRGTGTYSFVFNCTTPGTYTGPSLGNILTAANNASTNASAAASIANSANINAANAYNSVANANGNTITAVRDASGTALSEARQAKIEAHTANIKLDSIQTSITNIQNNLGADVTPPVVKIRTVTGALATSGSSIRAVLDVSDNAGQTFTYSLDGTDYSPVPANRIITLGVSAPGPNVIPVWVKDEAGNIGTSSITVRRL